MGQHLFTVLVLRKQRILRGGKSGKIFGEQDFGDHIQFFTRCFTFPRTWKDQPPLKKKMRTRPPPLPNNNGKERKKKKEKRGESMFSRKLNDPNRQFKGKKGVRVRKEVPMLLGLVKKKKKSQERICPKPPVENLAGDFCNKGTRGSVAPVETVFSQTGNKCKETTFCFGDQLKKKNKTRKQRAPT